ncbi:unnamed protein product [Thelazia callipaeda]|uniref:Low-density lipoprotein receptor domain class A n=1 Tax=Thelazia callipaeda TaxID=103827 RepID=A0A0N5D338_THECL|nr:unnamed protein product [Thelazia callipaeda]
MLPLPASGQIISCKSAWQWTCNNGECIAQYDLCNGIRQCSDGSDEIDCEHRDWHNTVSEEEIKSTVQSVTSVDKINPISPSVHFNFQWIFALASVFFIVLLLIIVIRRRRQQSLSRNNRAYGIQRSLHLGVNSGDEEDDLLISSLYS